MRPARELIALVQSAPFEGVAFSKDLRGWAAVMSGKPKSKPVLPLTKPAGKNWSVRFDRIEGPYALGLWRRRADGFVSPNELVESALGVAATMRYWETFERVAGLVAGE